MQSSLDVGRVGGVDKVKLEAGWHANAAEQAVGAAVKVAHGNDMVSRAKQLQDSVGSRQTRAPRDGCARCELCSVPLPTQGSQAARCAHSLVHTVLAVADGGKLLFEGVARGVAAARVLKALTPLSTAPKQHTTGSKVCWTHAQSASSAQEAPVTLCTPGVDCLKVVDMLMGTTTAHDGNFSGSWPAWMVSVPNDANGGRCDEAGGPAIVVGEKR